MAILEKINQDLKTAMLARDKFRVSTLRTIKSAILYVEVEQGKREEGLPDETVLLVLQKESKKREESAELFEKGGNTERAAAERAEKETISEYLPEQMSEEALKAVVAKVIVDLQANTLSDMGRVMASVRSVVSGRADGALLAKIVKDQLLA